MSNYPREDALINNTIDFFLRKFKINETKLQRSRPVFEWIFFFNCAGYDYKANRIISSNLVLEKDFLGHEVGHWLYRAVNEDPRIRDAERVTNPSTQEELAMSNLHECVAIYASIIYNNGKLKRIPLKTIPATHRAGYRAAKQLWATQSHMLFPVLLNMNLENAVETIGLEQLLHETQK